MFTFFIDLYNLISTNFSILSLLYVDFTDFIVLNLLAICFWFFLRKNTFRHKLAFFFLTIFYASIWGFIASFDGLILMMLLTELAVLLFVLFVFLSNKYTHEQLILRPVYFFVYMLFLWFIYFFSVFLSSSKVFFLYQFVYLYCHEIVTKDLAILYLFIVETNPLVNIYITLMLGLFSVFFICFFYQLREFSRISNIDTGKLKVMIHKRNQYFVKQAPFKPHIKMFQK